VLPEKAFLTRVLVQYCFEHGINDEKHDILPTVVDMAFLLEQRYEAIMALYEDDAATEMSIARAAFVLAELLRIGHFLDYSDHLGTHKMRLVIRMCRIECSLYFKCTHCYFRKDALGSGLAWNFHPPVPRRPTRPVRRRERAHSHWGRDRTGFKGALHGRRRPGELFALPPGPEIAWLILTPA
jgi:hypothetical protein